MDGINLQEHFACCPYCGERVSLLIELSLDDQSYIEDCEVCCRPVTVRVTQQVDGEPDILLLQENDIG